MFGFKKKKNVKKESTLNNNELNTEFISKFDYLAYLEANPDVKEAIENDQFQDAKHHLETFGLKEIGDGVRKFHKDFEPFSEKIYLDIFPNTEDTFKHFQDLGYEQILNKTIQWPITEEAKFRQTKKTVVAVIGIPLSGLTLTTSLLGLLEDSTEWFLPYSSRKNLSIKPFDNFNAIGLAYNEAFPNSEVSDKNFIVSETTSDEKNLKFIFESLVNFKKDGVDVKVLWVMRDINYTYLSQMGTEEKTIDEVSYVNYIHFALKGYKQIAEHIHIFDNMLISYENIIEKPWAVLEKISRLTGLSIPSKLTTVDLNSLKRMQVAGDPDFLEYNEQQEVWQKYKLFDNNLSESMKKFIQDFNIIVQTIECEKALTFSDFNAYALQEAFDSDYYWEQYEDVKNDSLGPFDHYMSVGWKENRNPAPWFNTKWYRENVYDNGVIPSLEHYIVIGQYLVKTESNTPSTVMENLTIIAPEQYVISDELILEAPIFSNPKVSIIITAYNQEVYTMACIESIIENTDTISYEIIVMDDKSSDKSAQDIEKNLKNIKFISNGINFGFLKNCNKGASFARGEYILLLNNDTNVQPGWLSPLVELIESSEDVGMVGSKLIYPTGELQEAGGIIWNDASAWNYGRKDDPDKPEYNYVRETDYLTGAVVMISKKLWNEIGGFDERYIPAYYEDSDLAFEVRNRGFKVLYQPKSVVIHFEGISNGTDIGSGIKQYQMHNQKKFYDKWKKEIKNHFLPNHSIFLARDCSSRKSHLLYVDHYLPHYDQDAGSKATYQYLKVFVKNNIQVHFIGDNFLDYSSKPYLNDLQQMGVEVLHGKWYEKHWKKWFEENGKYFNYVILSRPHIAVKYLETIRDYSDAKIIYMGHDLHFLRDVREYEIKGDKKYLKSSRKWLKSEIDIIQKSDVSYFFSDAEKKEILNIDKKVSVDIVPLYIYDKFHKEINAIQTRRDIMFVGGFEHSPNVDAMLWFVRKIWPKVERALPGVKFYIIGSKVPEEILALASDSVMVTGYVDDETLDTFYSTCKVAVAPLRYGAGVKGKVLDALYNGMPLVATTIGAEGLEDISEVMLVSDKSKKFAKHIISLYDDNILAEHFSKKALKYCEKYFSEKIAKKRMSNIFEEFHE